MATKKTTKKATKKATKASGYKSREGAESLAKWIRCRRTIQNESARTRSLVDPKSEMARECAKALREAQKHYTDAELASAWSGAASAWIRASAESGQ